MVEMLIKTLMYFVMGMAGLFILYIIARLCSSAVFRSYFEQRYNAFNKRRKKNERS